MTEQFNPFAHLNALRLEAVSRVQTFFSQAAFTDSVLPGRTIPNTDELPASLIYFADEPEIATAMDTLDNKLKPILQVVSYVHASASHPDSVLDARGLEIWKALDNYRFQNTAGVTIQGVGFSYETDADTQLTSLTVNFQLTFNSTVTA